MTGVRRTATTDETQGFMKVLVGASDDRILGFTIIGAEAGEVDQDALPASGVVDDPPGSGSVLMCRPLRSRERFICQEGTAQSIRA